MDLISTDLFGPKVQVHRGFFERYKIIRHEILKVVNKMGNKEDFRKPNYNLIDHREFYGSLDVSKS